MAGITDKGSLGLSIAATTPTAIISPPSLAPTTISAPVFRTVFV
jgi:hypothetical protein